MVEYFSELISFLDHPRNDVVSEAIKIILSLSHSAEAVQRLFSLDLVVRLEGLFVSFPREITIFLLNASSVYDGIPGHFSKIDFLEKIFLEYKGKNTKNDDVKNIYQLFGNLCKIDGRVFEFLKKTIDSQRLREALESEQLSNGIEYILCDLSSDSEWVSDCINSPELDDLEGGIVSLMLDFVLKGQKVVVPSYASLGLLKNLLFNDGILELVIKSKEYFINVTQNWILITQEDGKSFSPLDEKSQIILMEIYLLICRFEVGRMFLRKKSEFYEKVRDYHKIVSEHDVLDDLCYKVVECLLRD